MVVFSRTILRTPLMAGTLALTTSLGLGAMNARADYNPPALVALITRIEAVRCNGDISANGATDDRPPQLRSSRSRKN